MGLRTRWPELDSLRKLIADEDLWPVNWKVFTRRGLHSDRLRKWTGEPASLEQMISASQDYQAFVLKYHTEFFRRHKFAPCNGALFFQFRDCWPAMTASVVGLLRQEEEGLLRPAAGLQPPPHDDGLARPLRGAGGQHLPAHRLGGQRLRRGVPVLERPLEGAGRGRCSTRQRQHCLLSAREQPAAGRRSLMGYSRRRWQLPGDRHARTQRGTPVQQQLHHRSPRRRGRRGATGPWVAVSGAVGQPRRSPRARTHSRGRHAVTAVTRRRICRSGSVTVVWRLPYRAVFGQSFPNCAGGISRSAPPDRIPRRVARIPSTRYATFS